MSNKTLKAQIALKQQLDQALTNYKKTGDVRRTKGYLTGRISHISSLWSEFKTNHLTIYTADAEKNEELKLQIEKYTQSNQYEEFEAKYFDFLGELEDEVERKTPHQNSTQQQNEAQHQNDETHRQNQSERRVEIKLPRIDLPKFNGDYISWRAFHDMYVSLIHSDDRIPKVQKLHYLKSCLTGEAERIIKQFDMIDSNYEAAWETLAKRYNNTRVLVTSQLKVLFSQPIIKGESKKGIKELLDKTKECIHELNALNVSTKDWDPIILFLIVQRLPSETHKLWEQAISKETNMPKLNEMFEFLESRFRTLEAMSDSQTLIQTNTPRKTTIYHINEKRGCTFCKGNHTLQNCSKFQSQTTKAKRGIMIKHKVCFICLQIHENGTCRFSKQCPMCKEAHALSKCKTFQQLNVGDKRSFVMKQNLCFNCLKPHPRSACPSYHSCFQCGKRHHTILHEDTTGFISAKNDAKKLVQPSTSTATESSSTNKEVTTNCHYNRNQTQALLATSMVKVKGNNGITLSLRALIDLGSQSSFITESAYQALRLKGIPTSLQISGLGSTKLTTARKEVSILLQSIISPEFEIPIKAYVIKKITNIIPPKHVEMSNLTRIDNVQLADPNFLQPGNIDLLLGVNVYSKILCNGLIEGKNGAPTAQNTKLGWILFGEIFNHEKREQNSSFSAFINNEETPIDALNNQVKKFWECEEIMPQRNLTKEEQDCEEFYKRTHLRLQEGQYQVRLPFKNEKPPNLGDSKNQALSRYIHLEGKLKQNEELRVEYEKCINEYIKLGHMIPLNKEKSSKGEQPIVDYYYMPHHAVIKDSTTTKVRVVFDASAKSANKKSLNEQMMNGPTIQPKLFSTLLKWRKYKYAMTSDVQMMYRMVKIHPDDQKYQRILWRDNTGYIKEYELTTVTFGTTAAPYLAIRTLHQLAYDERENFPKGAEVALRDFYVDDVLTGADTIEDAIKIQTELLALLKRGGFNLRKWAANHDDLLKAIPIADREIQLPLTLFEDDQIKALGIYWHPTTDYFTFAIKPSEFNKPPTSKRNILSEIAKLYDPLGWIAPSVIAAKILMQKLWMSGCSWDEPVPSELAEEWQKFKDEIVHFMEIKIPRWVKTHFTQQECQIHAFCDASTRAYAAAVYIRTIDMENNVHVRLLLSKTKVAPIKPISLPRLELCGAVLLCRLVKQIKEDMQLYQIQSYCWTDSKIVLAWITGHPNKWQTFVANRVGEIQETNANNSWNYIPSKENPADLASRGVSPKNIADCEIWWNGPSWLRANQECWPKEILENNQTTLELKGNKNITMAAVVTECSILSKFSSFQKVLRVTAYCLRFIFNCKHKQNKMTEHLTAQELKQAKITILRVVQQNTYSEEITQLRTKKQVSKHSQLFKLFPFLDQDEIIRVGGRLQNSALSFEIKHPIILPKSDHVTNLIIDHYHHRTLHGGAQLVLNTIRMSGFWLVNGMNIVKNRIFKCVKCTRFRAHKQTQLMGNLPLSRVTQSRPFQNVGLDYAGPINLKMSRHRGSKTYKGYICIFVCMATKAIHIELVSDLTSEAFLAAFRRFIGRRGLCSNIYSDNGTTFVGAEKILQNEIKQATKHAANKTVTEGINWHFNPPYAPHMGGLWEASVKSIKHHLKRVLGETALTFEEFNTLLIQIEACVNSRPLSTLSADCTAIEALTPGHFLIGTAPLSSPEPDVSNENPHVLSRWKYLQQLRQHFWKRWTTEYVTQLQQRQKWGSPKTNVEAGTVVIIKDDKLPPLKWMLAVIENVHPGNDGKVRTVTLRTESAVIQRPITNICPLSV